MGHGHWIFPKTILVFWCQVHYSGTYSDKWYLNLEAKCKYSNQVTFKRHWNVVRYILNCGHTKWETATIFSVANMKASCYITWVNNPKYILAFIMLRFNHLWNFKGIVWAMSLLSTPSSSCVEAQLLRRGAHLHSSCPVAPEVTQGTNAFPQVYTAITMCPSKVGKNISLIGAHFSAEVDLIEIVKRDYPPPADYNGGETIFWKISFLVSSALELDDIEMLIAGNHLGMGLQWWIIREPLLRIILQPFSCLRAWSPRYHEICSIYLSK